VFHACLHVDSVSLSGVVGKLVMNELNDVISDWSEEDLWKSQFLDDLLLIAVVED